MSTDRVHFQLDTNDCGANNPVCEAYHKAFGQAMPRNRGTVTVVCRPSQFARFLIYRNDLGGRNGFKELEPKLVEGPDERVVDVSLNMRRRG